MLPTLAVVVPYVIFCFVLAFLGKEKKFGFWGNFFISILLSPLVGLVVLLAQDPISPEPQPSTEA